MTVVIGSGGVATIDHQYRRATVTWQIGQGDAALARHPDASVAARAMKTSVWSSAAARPGRYGRW